MEGFKLNEELRFEEMTPSFANKNSCSSRRAAGREQIVHQHNSFAGSYGIDVHLHFRFTIFERILRDLRLVGKLAALPDWDKTDTKFICNCRSKNEAARIDPDDFVNLSPAAALQKKINRRTEQRGIAQNGRDIFKHDPFLWEIRHIANSSAEFCKYPHGHRRER